jgi:hypothetical protein
MFDLIRRVQEIMFLMDCLHLLSRTAQMLESLVSLYIKALQHAAKPRCPRQRQKLQPSNCRPMDSSSRNLGASGSFGGGPFRVVLILAVLVIHQGSSPIHLLSSSPPPGTSFLIISAVKKHKDSADDGLDQAIIDVIGEVDSIHGAGERR